MHNSHTFLHYCLIAKTKYCKANASHRKVVLKLHLYSYEFLKCYSAVQLRVMENIKVKWMRYISNVLFKDVITYKLKWCVFTLRTLWHWMSNFNNKYTKPSFLNVIEVNRDAGLDLPLVKSLHHEWNIKRLI